jgi:hypothetical protein
MSNKLDTKSDKGAPHLHSIFEISHITKHQSLIHWVFRRQTFFCKRCIYDSLQISFNQIKTDLAMLTDAKQRNTYFKKSSYEEIYYTRAEKSLFLPTMDKLP